jgi:dipeptidyl aminopeptidase/acylaminoacyl peptidase
MRAHKFEPGISCMPVPARLCAFFIILGAAPPAMPQTSPGELPPLSARAMWELKRLGDPAISPDGKLAVLPVTHYDLEKNQGYTDLWMIPTAGGPARQLTSDAAPDTDPRFSPDGQWIAFVSKRDEDKQTQIYAIALTGGEARRITNLPTGASAPRWFPDSRRLAFVSAVWPDLKSWDEMAERMEARTDSKVSAKVWEKAPFSHWDRFLEDRIPHVYSIALDGGEPTAITLGTGYSLNVREPGADDYDVSPDGKEVAFSADTDRTGIDSNFDIFVAPANGGEARNLSTDNACDDTSPLYSRDGRWLAYSRQKIKGFYADRERLMLVDRRGGTTRNLTEEWDRSAQGLVWSPDSRALYGSIDDAAVRRIYRIDVANGTVKPLTAEASFSGLAAGASTLVAIRQTFSEPPTLVSVNARSGAATKLSTFNDAALAKVRLGKVESVTYKGARGQDIQMWVIYPPGFDASRKYPVYMLLHGGPHNAQTDGTQWRWNAQVFSGWGYITTWHNFHGSSGFGQAFADSINPDRISLPYEDTIKAAEYLMSQPYVDASRVAAGGGSYGGFLASTLLGRPHPFKALIAHAAVYDNFTQYASDYGAEKARFFDHWEQPTEFMSYSPHTAAANFNTPTLVIHGQLDMRVPVNHGFELFNTLQTRGVPSKLVYFPDENHWILKPQNSLFWYQATQDWLDKYIGATSP